MVFLYKDIMIELDQISQTDLCMLSFKSYLQEKKSKVNDSRISGSAADVPREPDLRSLV